MTRVVRIADPHDVRIDRRTPWGNPFPITPLRDRYDAIDQFEEWMRNSDDPKAKWIRANIHTLAGKTLACHCAPEACHGDILAHWADKKAAERTGAERYLDKQMENPDYKQHYNKAAAKLARTDDPWTSKLAAERIAPKTGTRKAKVLARLEQDRGTWVDGHELTTPDIGGSEGLRRLRELRVDGHPIERRPNPDSATSWQYRITETP